MGRKSLAPERRAQILDAFEACLLRYGLENSTLERIAQRAGVKRQIIRHYFGNRDALVEALVGRILATYGEGYQKALEMPVPGDRLERLLGFFIHPEPGLEAHTDRLMNALIVASEYDSGTRARVQNVYQSVTDAIALELQHRYPVLDEQTCRGTAYSLLALIFGNSVLLSLGFPARRAEDARAAAVRELEHLAAMAGARGPDGDG